MPAHSEHPANAFCPACGSYKINVVKKYICDDYNHVRRRRCRDCFYRWYTVQEPEEIVPPNYRVVYVEDKLYGQITKVVKS